MGNEESYFNKALSSFVKDFACKDEILAKARRGLSANEIYNELTYKIPIEEIDEIIKQSNANDEIVKVNGPLGKVSFVKQKLKN